jgi:Lon protease-like protein
MNSRQIPIFPLDIVVFPGEIIPLHIFEPRYLSLVNLLKDGEFDSFGISPILQNKIQRIGTTAVLVETKNEMPDGRVDIEVRAMKRFLLEEYDQEMAGYPFPGGRIIELPEPAEVEIIENEGLKTRIAELFQLLNIREKMPILSLPFYSYTWAPYIGMPVEKRYELLKMNTEKERQAYIEDHVSQILPILIETEQIRQKVESNGHFPEHFKAK